MEEVFEMMQEVYQEFEENIFHFKDIEGMAIQNLHFNITHCFPP